MIKFINLVVLFLSLPVWAGWVPNQDAGTIIDRADCSVLIKKDGNYEEEAEYTFTAKNENGRNDLALTTVPFMPESQTIEIVKAVSITDGVETPVDLKKIHEQTAKAPEGGVSSAKEYVIPFTNLKIGSSIKYKYKTISKKPLHPGVFAMQFMYGAREPEMGGKCVLKSEKRILFSVRDREKILKIEEGKEKELFTLTITQVKPATQKLGDEKIPILSHNSFSQVQVTTLESWNEFANLMADRYEKILQQELPPVFKAIADKAKAKKDLNEQIDVVTSELATIMTYSGDWTSVDKMYFPRGHTEVAASKTGDCKDFATTTTAILRKLGINASVALVGRKNPYSPAQIIQTTPIKEDLAMPSLFNHVIVRVERADKSVFWVDPTNIISNSRYSNSDIAGSATLNISKTADKLETVPFSKIEDSLVKIEKTIKIRADDKADSEGTLKGNGIITGQIVQTAFKDGDKKADEIALGLFGVSAKETNPKVVSKNYKSRIANTFEATISTSGEKIYVSKEGKELIVVPLPSFLEVYYLAGGTDRATDFYSFSKAKIESNTQVQGFDFDNEESNGCIAVSPWYDVERKLIKNDKGFEVRDRIVFKKEMISVSEIQDEEYGNSMGDLNDCVRSQAIHVSKLVPGQSLAKRLEGYTIEAINNLNDARGPGSTSKSLRARTMALQILEKKPDDLDAKIGLARSYRWIGYRKNDEFGPFYMQYADQLLDEVLAKSPDNAMALIQKSYCQARLHRIDEAKRYFNKAYYASTKKGFDIYALGGYITDKLNQPKVAMNSYLKAAEYAMTDSQRTIAYSKLGTLSRETEDFAKAEEYFSLALRYSPNDAWLMNDVLLLASGRQDFDKAIAIGEKMIKVSDFGVGRMNLADAYSGKAQSILKVNPNDNSRFEKAAEFAMKGLKWNDKSASCMIALAESLQGNAMANNDETLMSKSSEVWIKALAYAKSNQDRTRAMNGLNSVSALVAKMKNPRMPSSVKPSK